MGSPLEVLCPFAPNLRLYQVCPAAAAQDARDLRAPMVREAPERCIGCNTQASDLHKLRIGVFTRWGEARKEPLFSTCRSK
jgi:hypothetical protein